MKAVLEPPQVPLSDEVVALRPWRDADMPALVEACQDREVVRWTRVPAPYTDSDAREFMRVVDARQAAGDEIYFAAASTADDGLLGSFSVRPKPGAISEIGYWVAAPARRRGVATRALRLLAAWAFAADVARLQVVVDVDNDVSQRTALAAGFVREGVLRSYLDINDRRADAVMFSLLASEAAGS